MAKSDENSLPGWQEEFEKAGSTDAGIMSRLQFHGGLDHAWVTRMTGLAQNTVIRAFRRLAQSGKVTLTFDGERWYVRPVQNNI